MVDEVRVSVNLGYNEPVVYEESTKDVRLKSSGSLRDR